MALADDARRGCVVNAPSDPAYEARLLAEANLENTRNEIEITRDGQPVIGAKVCAVVFMSGMEAMGSSDDAAEETAPGIYLVSFVFLMSGGWVGEILVAEAGRAPASVRVEFDVA